MFQFVCAQQGGEPYYGPRGSPPQPDLGLDRGAPPSPAASRPGTGQGVNPLPPPPPLPEQRERYGVGRTPLVVTLEVFLVSKKIKPRYNFM